MARRFDSYDLASSIQTDEGYILAEGYAAKPGVLVYRRADGGVFRELVMEDEIASAESLETLARKPVTLEHPEEDVAPGNVKRLAVGDLDGEVMVMDNGYIKVKMAIRDRAAIDEVMRGKVQLSPGYTCRVDATPGVHPEYGPYDGIQRERRYNHLAIVSVARGGPDIRLRLDSEDAVLVQSSNDLEGKGVAMERLANLLRGRLNLRQDASEDEIIEALEAPAPVEPEKEAVPVPEPAPESAPAAEPEAEPALEKKGDTVDIEALIRREVSVRSALVAHPLAVGLEKAIEMDSKELRKALALKTGLCSKQDASDDYYQGVLDSYQPQGSLSKLSFDGKVTKKADAASAPGKVHPWFLGKKA